MPYQKPKAEPIDTIDLCEYGCGNIALFKFAKGKICCSQHQNSCIGKRKLFSDRVDHKQNAAKSLATRTALGITKTSQIKGGATRRASGHYQKLAKTMQEHWAKNPWQNNLECPILPYKNTELSYQGSYEFEFLEEIEFDKGIEWVVTNVKRGPSIWYIDPTDNTERLYISDFIINDTIYEIKSDWTWNKHGKDLVLEEKNKAKLTACVKQGYNAVLVLNQKRILYEAIMG
jgi:hypothetical protein